MWARLPNPLRSAIGSGPAFTAVNFSAQALYNNSPGPHTLRVWMIGSETGAAAVLYFLKGRLTTHDNGTIAPAVTDQPVPPGTIDQQDLASLPSTVFSSQGLGAPPIGQGNSYPFAVLRPGVSLVVAAPTTAVAWQVCFYWDYVFPDEIINPKIGDPEIDP